MLNGEFEAGAEDERICCGVLAMDEAGTGVGWIKGGGSMAERGC